MKWIIAAILAFLLWIAITKRSAAISAVGAGVVDLFAEGVARAEGFYVKGSLPARLHNPGDIKADLIGKSVGKDSSGIAIFATDADGWANLKAQVSKIFNGESGIYTPEMSILQVAMKYTATTSQQFAWARTVSEQFSNASVDTVIKELRA